MQIHWSGNRPPFTFSKAMSKMNCQLELFTLGSSLFAPFPQLIVPLVQLILMKPTSKRMNCAHKSSRAEPKSVRKKIVRGNVIEIYEVSSERGRASRAGNFSPSKHNEIYDKVFQASESRKKVFLASVVREGSRLMEKSVSHAFTLKSFFSFFSTRLSDST